MKGVEAVADALLRCTDRQYTIPGFPVTGLGALIRAELVINEKTALEYALGDSLMGRRAAVIVKHVGVNACADPLLQATPQGLIGGVVLVAGDDPDALGSQTAQGSLESCRSLNRMHSAVMPVPRPHSKHRNSSPVWRCSVLLLPFWMQRQQKIQYRERTGKGG
jgi:TPP-dependent indolepyruvate ferredoxin oxidoreductase alpha subunit